MTALWIALLFVSDFGVVASAVYGKKRKSVKERITDHLRRAVAEVPLPPFPYEKDFFGAEKFALKYDVPDDLNLYNKICQVIARRQNL